MKKIYFFRKNEGYRIRFFVVRNFLLEWKKIEGEAPGLGLSLVNQETGEVVSIPATSVLVNEPSRNTFLFPAGLAPGDYKFNLCTQFSTSSQALKEARSYVFDYMLNVAVR